MLLFQRRLALATPLTAAATTHSKVPSSHLRYFLCILAASSSSSAGLVSAFAGQSLSGSSRCTPLVGATFATTTTTPFTTRQYTSGLCTLTMTKSDTDNEPPATPTHKASRRKATFKTSTSTKEESASPQKAPKRAKKDNNADTPKAKPKKAPAHQVLTDRDVLPKLWDAAAQKDSYTFTIASWNVAGLRALQKKDPDAISNLIQKLDLDVLCLQETKLQEAHLTDPKVSLPDVPGYTAHYSCSTAKKGYAGTAVFIRNHGGGTKKKGMQQMTLDAMMKKGANSTNNNPKAPSQAKLPIDAKWLQPESVTMEMGVAKHDQEGRVICMDFPLFTAVNLYVPNSGQKLERLTYRTEEWDKDLLAFMQQKQKERDVPVLWLGDLNVAHTHLEVWNDGAKHLAKQAGVTAEERASFQAQLDAGFVDAFRHLHPTAAGHYTYWSQRAGNRAPNKGLRLDYFVCDPRLLDDGASVVVRDSYMVPDQEGSDHCPAVLELEIKKTVTSRIS